MTNDSFDIGASAIEPRMFVEASAGTGKTYTLQRIILRLVLEEEIQISRFLVVTFTKAATAELSERVRGILMTAKSALECGTEQDGILALSRASLARAGVSEQEGRRRLARAVHDFDRCGIYTIHSFCNKMLKAWAFSAGLPFDLTLEADDGALKRDVTEEFLRKFLNSAEGKKPGMLGTVTALEAKGAFGWILARNMKSFEELESFLPPSRDKEYTDEEKTVLGRFLGEVPQEVGRRKLRSGVLSYDGLLEKMREEVLGNAFFRERVRSEYSVVLVDEFQDTDAVQYDIFRELFLSDEASGVKHVIFVGDPKQSIYRFRGAEIQKYFDAKEDVCRGGAAAERCRSLGTNYRTAPALVRAVNHLFERENSFETPEIVFSPVNSSDKRTLLRKTENGFEEVPVFELWTGAWEEGMGKDAEGFGDWAARNFLNVGSRRKFEARRIARDIALLLSGEFYSGERLRHLNGAEPDRAALEAAALRAGDIAILVRRHGDADDIERELARCGIGCLHARQDDVFQTEEAREMLQVLEAAAEPEDGARVSAARSTRICGRPLSEIRKKFSGEHYLGDLTVLKDAAEKCARYGLPSALSFIFKSFGVTGRMLRVSGGERALTNYGHIGELLCAEYERQKNLPGLVRWFGMELAKEKASSDEKRKVRLESDESLVRIETVFASKGLEYPVVYVPGASDYSAVSPSKVPFVPRDSDAEKNAGNAELVRLAYVAATRASARLVISMMPFFRGWKGSYSAQGQSSAWVRLFAGKIEKTKGSGGKKRRGTADPAVPAEKTPAEKINEAIKAWERKACRSGSGALVKCMGPEDDAAGAAQVRLKLRSEFEVKHLLRPAPVPREWESASYSKVTRGFELADAGEERLPDEGYAESGAPARAKTSEAVSELDPAFIRGGKDTGDAVHDMIEACFLRGLVSRSDEDWNSDHAFSAVFREKGGYGLAKKARLAEDEEFGDRMKAAFRWTEDRLKGVFRAKLPGADVALSELPAGCASPELPFCITVKSGLKTGEFASRILKLNRTLDEAKRLPLEDIRVTGRDFVLNGYLEGRIDLLAQTADGKFWLADWKTDQPGDRTAAAYRSEEALGRAMTEDLYGWQALFYMVALRRMIAFRFGIGLEEAGRRIGGMLYVFVRGFSAADPQARSFVLLQPDASLVAEADAILSGDGK